MKVLGNEPMIFKITTLNTKTNIQTFWQLIN